MGRAGARAELSSALEAASSGHGRLVLVTGEPGMGKTTLARDVADEARRLGVVVRWAACWSGGATVAHAPWLNLLAGLGAPGEGALAALLGADTGDLGAATSARAHAYALVAGALQGAAAEQPMLIVLDDLHWADAGTVALLGAVAGSLPATPVLVVGTYRDAEVLPGSPLTRLGASADRLGLLGLSIDEVAQVLTEAVGRDLAAAVATDVRARTGGNPFLVVQLGRLVAADPAALTGDGPLPAGARDLLGGRLAVLADDDRRALVAAAVLGSPFGVPELAAVVGVDGADVIRSLDRAAAARVVERTAGIGAWTFVHDLFRQAALDGVPHADVVELHRRAAELLMAGDAEPAVIARHLLAATDGPSLVAAEWSLTASNRALAAMAWEEATAHAEQALSCAPQDASANGLRGAALLGLGRARLLTGDLDGAGRAFDGAADLARTTASPELLADAALGYSLDLTGFEVRLFHQRQIDLLEEAAAALVATGHRALRATVLARLSVALSLTAPGERRLALVDDAVALARDAGDPIVLAGALAAHCDAISGPDHSEQREQEASEIIAIAERAGDGPLELLGRRHRFVARLEQGDFRGATDDAAAFSRRADVVGNPLYSWFASLWRGQAALADGDVVIARQAVAEVEQLGLASSSLNAPMLALVLGYMTSFREGSYLAVVEQMEALFAETPELAQHIASVGAPAVADIHSGRPENARAALDGVVAIGLDHLAFDAEWLPAMVTLVEAAWLVDHELLGELVDRLAPYAHRCAFEGIGAGLDGSVARYLALGCSGLGRHDDAVAYARQALDANRAAGTMVVADTERALAVCLDARGEPGDGGDAAQHHGVADRLYAAAGFAHLVRGSLVVVAEAAPATVNELRRDGEVWHVRFGGDAAIVKHSKGIADLAVLLADAGREVHVSELEGVPREALGAGGGAALDRRAIAAYKERLAELAAEVDDADAAHDLGRAEKARIEYDALIDQLSGSLGLGGRPRSAGAEPIERLRKAVAARVRDAIRRIEAVQPALGRHLAHSVRTGIYCSYQPEVPTVWRCQARSGASRS